MFHQMIDIMKTTLLMNFFFFLDYSVFDSGHTTQVHMLSAMKIITTKNEMRQNGIYVWCMNYAICV